MIRGLRDWRTTWGGRARCGGLTTADQLVLLDEALRRPVVRRLAIRQLSQPRLEGFRPRRFDLQRFPQIAPLEQRLHLRLHLGSLVRDRDALPHHFAIVPSLQPSMPLTSHTLLEDEKEMDFDLSIPDSPSRSLFANRSHND